MHDEAGLDILYYTIYIALNIDSILTGTLVFIITNSLRTMAKDTFPRIL